jgi:hypothetical protein
MRHPRPSNADQSADGQGPHPPHRKEHTTATQDHEPRQLPKELPPPETGYVGAILHHINLDNLTHILRGISSALDGTGWIAEYSLTAKEDTINLAIKIKPEPPEKQPQLFE